MTSTNRHTHTSQRQTPDTESQTKRDTARISQPEKRRFTKHTETHTETYTTTERKTHTHTPTHTNEHTRTHGKNKLERASDL